MGGEQEVVCAAIGYVRNFYNGDEGHVAGLFCYHVLNVYFSFYSVSGGKANYIYIVNVVLTHIKKH